MNNRDEYMAMVVGMSPEDKQRHLEAWLKWLTLLLQRQENEGKSVQIGNLLVDRNGVL